MRVALVLATQLKSENRQEQGTGHGSTMARVAEVCDEDVWTLQQENQYLENEANSIEELQAKKEREYASGEPRNDICSVRVFVTNRICHRCVDTTFSFLKKPSQSFTHTHTHTLSLSLYLSIYLCLSVRLPACLYISHPPPHITHQHMLQNRSTKFTCIKSPSSAR